MASAMSVSGPSAMIVTSPGNSRALRTMKSAGGFRRGWSFGAPSFGGGTTVGFVVVEPDGRLVQPRAGKHLRAVRLFPEQAFRAGVHERKHRAGQHGHVGAAGDFQQPQRVGNAFVAPHVAADHRDAQQVHGWVLQEQGDRLQVGGRRAARVLVDDDLAPGRPRLEKRAGQPERQESGEQPRDGFSRKRDGNELSCP